MNEWLFLANWVALAFTGFLGGLFTMPAVAYLRVRWYLWRRRRRRIHLPLDPKQWRLASQRVTVKAGVREMTLVFTEQEEGA